MPPSKAAMRGKRSAQKPATVTSTSRPGPKAAPVVEFPEPLFTDWIDPVTFHDALALHMQRHGDSCWQLWRGIIRPETH
jgi:hypothetical protein